MSQHERATFTQGREVLQHSVDYLKSIVDRLEALRDGDHDRRVVLLLNSVEVEQRNLLGAVERLLEDTTRKVLDTYAQYTVELPGSIEAPEEPLTTLGLTQWLTGCNGHLQTMFAELGDKGDSQEAAEVFAGLAQQVEAHDRRLSKEYQRTEDL